MSRAPALFLAHGAPTIALEPGGLRPALQRFFASAGRPRAIVIVSAHWTSAWEVGITSADRHRLIYDFGGFPQALYELRWPAPGDPALAARVAALVDAAGFRARLDSVRGLDHGAWMPLFLAFPAADVPVVQVALPELEPPVLLRLGAALAPLRDDGVLVVGSGGLVHNLGLVRLGDPGARPDAWAREFDRWAAERIAALDVEGLARWREDAPYGARAVPTPEHLAPVFVALGARAPDDRPETIHDEITHGNLAMRSFALRPAGPPAGTSTAARKEKSS